MSGRPLRTLDLFSGIGGMTRGLHGIAEPVMYCDIAPESRRVLASKMDAGLLPRAPVSGDVRELTFSPPKVPTIINPTKKDAKKYTSVPEVDMVVAGFPCVGFSVMGLGEAFENEESGLFREVLRICDSVPSKVPMIFLENVANVLRTGMDVILAELATKRGYEVRWVVVSAADVGAPHVRSRWFCLAVQPSFAFAMDSVEGYARYGWSPHAEEQGDWSRTAPDLTKATKATKDGQTTKDRCGLLGNSVVPDAVRFAFLYMLSRNAVNIESLSPSRVELTNPTNTFVKTVKKKKQRYPKSGVFSPIAGKFDAFEPVFPSVSLSYPGPVIDPASFASDKPPSPLLKTALITEIHRMPKWSTPRHSLTGACNYLTERSIRDLPTQVRFAQDTLHREWPVSAEFLEFLMGFPIGWTRC